MELITNLDNTVEKWHLLQHPFYRAWTNGTLPESALQLYAEHYGEFITALPRGWEAIGDSEYVQEEVEHIEMWQRFAGTLGTQISTSDIPQMRTLMETCDRLFADRVTALGAMYAFERQQPETAQSKLEGLRTHFAHLDSEGAEEYFAVHSHMQHEAQEILRLMEPLSPEDRNRALAACEEMCEAVWNSLTGVMEASGMDTSCMAEA